MIAVIFEVRPHAGERDHYLAIAADLRPLLEQVDGFISVERFESLVEPGKLLSLSFWRDEEAVRNWRCAAAHRDAQDCGRAEIFSDYRLRIAGVIRDYGMFDRAQAPAREAEARAPAAPRAGRSTATAKGPLRRLALRLTAKLGRLYAAYCAEEHLNELDDRLLKDIGVTRSEIQGAVWGCKAAPSERAGPLERAPLLWQQSHSRGTDSGIGRRFGPETGPTIAMGRLSFPL